MRVRDRDGRAWMAQALSLAALADGTTSPNPRVGCLLVRDGAVVGRGFHRVAGGAHAEVLAVREAGDLARGSTAYVSLEPCAHHGRTPPCADLLAKSGVKRVVVAMRDPNPLVDGRGIDRLREAGIQVEVGLMEAEAVRLNEAFVHWHRRARPLVTLKAALSADGLLSADQGCSQWITGPAARRFAHRLRLRSDAIVVGSGTVTHDDPRLTVRLPDVSCQPLRIVLSGGLGLDPAAKIFRCDDGAARAPRIYTVEDAPAAERGRLERVAEIVTVANDGGGRPDLRAVLQHLAESGIQSVLVEGGGATHHAFLADGLADRAAFFYAPRVIGARGATPLADGPAVAAPALGARLEDRKVLSLGPDVVLLARIARASGD